MNLSRLGSLSSACARRVARSAATAAARVCHGSPSPAVSAAVARVHASTLHDACSNSWSDTVRVQGPTGTRRVKGRVSGLAEDLRPVSEVETGVNFSAGRRCTGAGCRFTSHKNNQAQVPGNKEMVGAVTLSFHPEIPENQYASPGRGLDIRQSMGWTKVCQTARSGIWVLKGDARARMLPANLNHLRVGWKTQGSYETAWVTPGHDCLCPYQYGRGAAVGPQTNDAIWDGVFGLWCRVAPLLSPRCARGNMPTGVNLNRYSGSGSCIPWHSDNESLFGPQNSPKLKVSMSLGHSVVFQVRRVPGDVPSSITLDHGDLLVMDGSAQSEYAHHTVPGLQGPQVNFSYRWVTQHIASCPLAGVVCKV